MWLYVRQVMDDDILVEVHPRFEQIARERGFYSPDLMKRIAEHGSIQNLEEIPVDVRRLFVTAHEIPFGNTHPDAGCLSALYG